MPYTPFSDANITTFIGLFTYANSVTNNWFAIVSLAVVYIVMFVTMSGKLSVGSLNAFAATSYIGLILTILFRIGGLVKDQIVILAIVLAAISLLFIVTKKRGEE